MNLEHHPQVAEFLSHLGSAPSDGAVTCPICGQTIEVMAQSGRRISAICPNCDFHATVPQNRINV